MSRRLHIRHSGQRMQCIYNIIDLPSVNLRRRPTTRRFACAAWLHVVKTTWRFSSLQDAEINTVEASFSFSDSNTWRVMDPGRSELIGCQGSRIGGRNSLKSLRIDLRCLTLSLHCEEIWGTWWDMQDLLCAVVTAKSSQRYRFFNEPYRSWGFGHT